MRIEEWLRISLCRVNVVYLPHDPLGPLNRSGNHGFGPGAWLRIEEIVGTLQVTRPRISAHCVDLLLATTYDASFHTSEVSLR